MTLSVSGMSDQKSEVKDPDASFVIPDP